jgi:hypothetical protein
MARRQATDSGALGRLLAPGLLAGIAEDPTLLAEHKSVAMDDIIDVGYRAAHAVNNVQADVDRPPKVQPVYLLLRVHFWDALLDLILRLSHITKHPSASPSIP